MATVYYITLVHGGGNWDDPTNWYTNASGLSPLLDVPSPGDNIEYGTGESSVATITSVSVSVGTCNIAVTVDGGTITAGTFSGDVTVVAGSTIGACTCTAALTNNGTIAGATSSGALTNNGTITSIVSTGANVVNNGNIIRPGSEPTSFSGANFNNSSGATIGNGTFTGQDLINASGASISGGDFRGNNLMNSGTVTGAATYSPSATVAFTDLIIGGLLQVNASGGVSSDPGGVFAAAGGYLPQITVSGIPVPGGGGGGPLGGPALEF